MERLLIGFVVAVLLPFSSAQICGIGWHGRNNHCYYVTRTEGEFDLTWHEARNWCYSKGTELASIHSTDEKIFIRQIAEENGFTGSYWLGYNQLNTRNGQWSWDDGSSNEFEDWGPGQPAEGGLELCTYSVVRQDSNAQVRDMWDRRNSYNVVKGLLTSPDQANGVNIFNFGQLTEFKYDECEKKCEEQDGCVAYTLFATFYSDEAFKGYCMGRTNQYSTNAPDENTLAGFKKDFYVGYWYSSNCGYRMGFACKGEGTAPTSPPNTTPPTTVVPGYCPDKYIAVGNKCFLVEKRDSETGLTWEEALQYCRARPGRHADLASIQNSLENAVLTAQLQQYSYGFWIGFHRGTTNAEDWVWADNGENAYTNWFPGTPEDNKGDCAELWNNRYPGTWNDHHCTDKRGFVCQTYKDGTFNNPPLTTPNSCPTGYTPYWYGCYKLEDRYSWNQAESRCTGEGGHLASVYSEAENSALFYFASQQKREFPIWLGMTKGSDGEFRWSDGWAVHYTNWASGHPSTGECVGMDASGKWRDYRCVDVLHSVCKKTDAPAYTTPTPRPGVCPSSDWLEWGGHCYYFATQAAEGEDSPLKTYSDANDRCRGMAGKGYWGHLVTIHSDAENNFVFGELQKRADAGAGVWMSWIGLQDLTGSGSGYHWVDGTPVSYVKWVPGQRESHPCVMMHVQLWQGLWQPSSCDEDKFFVCKASKAPSTEPPSMPPPAKGKCPKGETWDEFDKKCIVFYKDDAKRHSNSTAQCQSLAKQGSLVSIHSEAENYVVREGLRSGAMPWGWIGLYRKPGDSLSTWHWADGTPVDYVNWEPGEPNDFNGREFCVEMDSSIGQWNDVECDIDRIFACAAPKAVDDGLGGGAIFGIIVGVLALVALIGAVGYFVALPYARDNNLLDKLPFGSASSSAGGAGASNFPAGFDNVTYENDGKR